MELHIEPVSVIEADLGIEHGGDVHAFFTDRCEAHMKKYVPYSGDDNNTIHLNENVIKTVDSIIYESPYAHAQYVGYTTGPVVNYTTPGTGPYWDKLMVSAEMQDVIKEVQDYVDRGR